MPTIKVWLFVLLAAFAVFFVAVWALAIRRLPTSDKITPGPIRLVVGFITDFLDTLGIGSFATTTFFFRSLNLVAVENTPGTLNVGHTLPTIAQAFIYIAIVRVEALTLVLLIVASVIGMWVGSGITAQWPRRRIQTGMGIALLISACFLLWKLLNEQGDSGLLELRGVPLWIAVGGNFILGALMALGIGLYGPCLIMLTLLGMNPKAAFPIMMGSCAFLMPVGSIQFIRKGRYDPRAALGLAIGGIPAVLIAAYVVKELDLKYLMWLVMIVVVYTAASLLHSAVRDRNEEIAAETPADLRS